jgi:hypothetical protein
VHRLKARTFHDPFLVQDPLAPRTQDGMGLLADRPRDLADRPDDVAPLRAVPRLHEREAPVVVPPLCRHFGEPLREQAGFWKLAA